MLIAVCTGAHCRHGGLRFVFPLDRQEVPAQVLLPHARSAQHSASVEGVVRERGALLRLFVSDRVGRDLPQDVQDHVQQPGYIQYQCDCRQGPQ